MTNCHNCGEEVILGGKTLKVIQIKHAKKPDLDMNQHLWVEALQHHSRSLQMTEEESSTPRAGGPWPGSKHLAEGKEATLKMARGLLRLH